MSDGPSNTWRWCGICFDWRQEEDGRCADCRNADMRGESLPLSALRGQADEKAALLRHLREKHPNLLSSMLTWTDIRRALEGTEALSSFATGCLPTSGLSAVPMPLILLVHRAAHLGLWSDHAEDDWLCRDESTVLEPCSNQAPPGAAGTDWEVSGGA